MREHNQNRASGESKVVSFLGGYGAFSDMKLVELVRTGDHRAFEFLMQRYMPIVRAYLWGKMWERDEIADLAQEIFIRAYTKIDQLRDGARFNQWVVRIARHAWVDYCRHPGTQRRKKFTSLDVMEPDSGSELQDSRANPVGSAGEGELKDMVRLAIGELKERYRLIVYLRLLEEKSNKEIASLTGLKEDAVRTRFSRGLGALRKSLVKKGLEPF